MIKKKFGKITAWIAKYKIDDKVIVREKHVEHPEIGQMFLETFGAREGMTEEEIWEAYKQNRFKK